MLVVFSPTFVADTKIIFRYDFVAPLKNISFLKHFCKMLDHSDTLWQKFPDPDIS